jgi:lipid-binding SYLF domain-containing protein
MKNNIYKVLALAALITTSACIRNNNGQGIAQMSNPFSSNQVEGEAAAKIDARVDVTRNYLFENYPGAQELETKAAGVLYMPLVTEAGYLIGGAYGRGALRVGNVTENFYSTAKATYGFQIGAQQYAHALFLMTSEALESFRSSEGWGAGSEMRYATPEHGLTFGKRTAELEPVVAYVFGQSGLIAGANLSGIKYTRIRP